MNTLDQLVKKHPFPTYQSWWSLGPEWSEFMSEAIVSQWQELPELDYKKELEQVETDVNRYINTVYKRPAHHDLLSHFVDKASSNSLQSGEFDAISYAFYKSAFTLLRRQNQESPDDLNMKRRQFTRKIGHSFFHQLHKHLDIHPPKSLDTADDLTQLKQCLKKIGNFVCQQGYLRDHFAFKFDVLVSHNGKQIKQTDDQFIQRLNETGQAHAIYEMGYPAILPSAVYLYHGIGEAQHHSSRIIEDLFTLIHCQASETDDFDPVGYPADQVVELWEINKPKYG